MPEDITYNELYEQLYNWGEVINVNIIKTNGTSMAFITFSKKEEADYFIKALNKTKYEFMIINVIDITKK